MSIILDALKRSDRERRLQKPPDLSQIYQENHPPRRNPMIWILLIIVVFVGGIAGAYLFFQRNPEIENAKRPEKAIVTAGNKKTPPEKQKSLRKFSAKSGEASATQKAKSPGNTSQKSVTSFPIQRKPSPREVDQSRDLETMQKDSQDSDKGNPFATIMAKANRMKEETGVTGEGETAKKNPFAALFGRAKTSHEATSAPVSEPSSAGSSPSVPDSQVDAPPPSRDSTAILSTPKGITMVEPEPAQVEASKPVPEKQAKEEAVKQESVAAAQPEPVKESAPVPSEKQKVTLVDDLPYETRQKYEDLQINVHIYDEKPEERRVFINMHSYKEGEKIEEGGPLLVAIIPEGIIVDYGRGKCR